MPIRRARDEDCAAIARLRRQTIRHVNASDYSDDVIRRWSAQETAQTLRASADRCKRWVALDHGKIVGFCEHNFDGEISRIYVHKDHLRKGIGSRLLATAEVSLEKLNCHVACLESTVTAKGFYAARGYKVVERAVHGGNKSEPVYKMRKKL
ncbi:MAG TPA: GNAT family N-acetyltransferase [Dongiaceae bacterium]|nr:GNAT family N-acetyltransferase [Dongiaceae bacterium]